MGEIAEELVPGLWYWTTRHPEWHPGEFGAEVGAYAVADGDDLILVDPLLPHDAAEADALLTRLDALADGRQVTVAITIGYHVRSSEALATRYRHAEIRGPKQCASRLEDPSRLTVPVLGEAGPAGISVLHVGKPRRAELPLWLPSHRAIVFGDALVTAAPGELRMWAHDPVDAKVEAFYRDQFAPTLAPLVALGAEHVLTTHGPPIIGNGTAALKSCAAAAPWYHRG
ncbi:MAG: hypothetical protein J7513_13560 [Solirubrobacteraceae bacterium]|nr:hypothetical protein [Solirubrobacteraceae bacterium]